MMKERLNKFLINKRTFLLLHLLAFLLLGSWLVPFTRRYWDIFDLAVFRLLNTSIVSSPITQFFWAIANVRFVDIFGAIYTTTFFLLYVFEKKEKRPLRLAQFIYLCFWMEIGILLSKEGATWLLKSINFMRDSPSYLYHCPVLLSKVAPWLVVKDCSHCSFPSDHALIALQWASFIWFFCGTRLGLLALISATFFVLPRLIAGAHWITDLLIGSMTMILILLAWSTCTSIYPTLMAVFEKWTRKIFRQKDGSHESTV